ncbi:hypothetical protein DSL64_07925 [Dyadobacter luteus]|uniref:Outer membrane protein beta-barrel domain-containing protein n=1 Tax=Dyadobacter luteus TaxID=2259619 RepID=A0A3D8YE96_9BACT|nr:porin family protein [Dyadobacter luteus]REA62841.1 hypothetical protein DSL64_07925 [Dyadobacter luteus]
MKKYHYTCLLSIFTFLIFCAPLYAQYHIGVRGGMNFAKFGSANVIDYKVNVRPSVAVILNKPLNSAFSIQLEPGFSGRGARYDDEMEYVSNNVDVRQVDSGKIFVNYIEMPILFQYKSKLGALDLILSAGPDVKLLVGKMRFKASNQIYHDGVTIIDAVTDTKFDRQGGWRSFDYGLTGGAGLAYPLKNLKLFAEARYHMGLRKIISSGFHSNNRGLSAHAGILFPIKF